MAGRGPSREDNDTLEPVYSYDSVDEYTITHKAGTVLERDFEVGSIENFNRQRPRFPAWPLILLDDKGSWILLVEYSSKEWKLPQEGEACGIQVHSKLVSDNFCRAKRIINTCRLWGLDDKYEKVLNKYCAFEVVFPRSFIAKDAAMEGKSEEQTTSLAQISDKLKDSLSLGHKSQEKEKVKHGERRPGLHPILHAKDGKVIGEPQLTQEKKIMVSFDLRVSTTTAAAELHALNGLATMDQADEKYAAFEYLVRFKPPSRYRNILDHFPHMGRILDDPEDFPPRLVELLRGFDSHQRKAFFELLKKLPHAIGIVPGGPGAGKTHWNLVTAAAAQSKDCIVSQGKTDKTRVKVLYLIDLNKPLSDVASKMVRLYQELGLDKITIRMYGWNYEVAASSRDQLSHQAQCFRNRKNDTADNKEESKYDPKDDTSERIPLMDFSRAFRDAAAISALPPRRTGGYGDCLAPTLDEAAVQHFEKHRDGKYRNIKDMMETGYKGCELYFAQEVENLYRAILAEADFVATTPVSASKFFFSSAFKPHFVFFDESPHARDASNLIALWLFRPAAWIFSGDYRQTRPFVASAGQQPCPNKYARRLQVSMMERAELSGQTSHALLVNHRAYGNLHELPSEIFYDGRLVSGIPQDQRFPPSPKYLQKYLSKILKGVQCDVPRIVVELSYCDEPEMVNTSPYNQEHIDWVMDCVKELVQDRQFLQVDQTSRGTILIITPYKEAYSRYHARIEFLRKQLNEVDGVEYNVEARTIDTVQGHQADIVFLDLVRDHCNKFIDDPNRLCVAMTRARQAEIVMMHPDMVNSGGYRRGKYVKQIRGNPSFGAKVACIESS